MTYQHGLASALKVTWRNDYKNWMKWASENRLPVLRKPPQCEQMAAVLNHPCSLLYTATSIQRKPPYSELQTPKSRPNGQNQYKFLSENGQSRLTGAKQLKIFAVLEDFSCFYPFFDISRPLCTRGVLVHAMLSKTWHAATGKGCHITRCTLCIEDTSLLRTI